MSLARGIYVFYEYQGAGILAYAFFDGNTWNVNQVVPNTGTSGPAGVVFCNNKLYCFHQGGGNLWYNVFDGASWRGDQQVDNTNVSHSPSAVICGSQTYVFHQGADDGGNPNGELWYNIYEGSGNWSGDSQVQNTSLHGSPSAIVLNSQLLCFHRGTGSQANRLWVNTLSPQGNWLGDTLVDPALAFTNSPGVVIYNGALWCFYQSSDGSNMLYCEMLGSNLSVLQDQPVPGASLWWSPAACVFDNRLYCFHHANGSDQDLYGNVFVGNQWTGDFQVPGVSIGNSPSVVVVD